MPSDDEDECEEATKFVRRPPKVGSNSSRLQRPRSFASSQIISNPKLVKSLQNLDIGPRFTLIRPASCVNIRAENPSKRLEIGKHLQEEFDLQKSYGNGGDSHDRGGLRCHKYLGLILALFASLVFSLSSIIVKAISEVYHPYTLSLWTFQGIFLPSLAILLFQGGFGKQSVCQNILPLRSKGHCWNFLLVLLRALCGAGGTVLKVYSLQFMTAPDSTVIAFSSPVFVVIVAWIFLDEKCGFIPILTAIAVLVGVGIITRPPWITGQKEFDTELLIGCGMAVGCMLLGVFTVVILRYIRDVHYALITFVYGLIGTVGSVGLCWMENGLELPKTMQHWFYAFGIAFLTFLGQTTLTLALQYEQAGLISLIRPSEILFIFLWQFIFLKQIPDWLSMVGAFIVLVGVIVITARKWITTLPEKHYLRKSCAILLL